MDTIFRITGGLGKHVLATSVINSYKDQHPDNNIITISAWPEVFLGNPRIDESHRLGSTQYFYKNYIHNKDDVEVYAQEPYNQADHILGNKHLQETWCDMLGIDHTARSSVHLNYRERELTLKDLDSYKDKPIVVFQPFGGSNTNIPYSWARDIHPATAQMIVDSIADKCHVLHICNQYHPQLQNCIRIDNRMSSDSLFTILSISQYRILIDSALQHAANAMNLPSLVIWNVTSPKQFGYSTHINITPDEDYVGHPTAVLFPYEIGGIPNECPFDDPQKIYTDEVILDKVLKYIE